MSAVRLAALATLTSLALSNATHAASAVADAVMRGDAETLAGLLRDGADVNAVQPDSATALHWAAYRDDVDAARQLLEAGAHPTVANREGMTPLALASIAGNAEMIRLLAAAGADIHARLPNGETMLMLAARTGSVAGLEALLDLGAEIDTTEALRGTTALMWAAAYSNPPAVELLLARDADPSLKSAVVERGRGPYLAPAARERIEEFERGTGLRGAAVAFNLDAGDSAERPDEDARPAGTATPSAATPPTAGTAPVGAGATIAGDDAAEAEAAAAESFFNRRQPRDAGGLTALIFAAREGDLASAASLLAHGADVNQTSEYGWTPLLAATQNRYYELGKFLLERGADPNIANKGGWNPLYIATDNRNIEGGDYPTRRPDMDHLDYIELLLARGADPNLRMKSSTETRTIFTHQWLFEEGATPFLRAAQSGDLVIMRLLLEHGADPNIPTEHNVTPLMVASGIGWVEGVTFEWSPEQTLEAIELLLELGADVNAQDTLDYRTALMGAAHKGRNDVVQLLVDNGADSAARDIGSRDSIHALAGVTWQAIDYADGLVRVGVQSAIAHPETAALLRELMMAHGLPVPPAGRTLDSICITDVCK
jgi:ankyrin repeat protein